MTGHLQSLAFLVQFLMQRLAVLAFAIAAVTLTVVTVMATFGQAPWLEFSVTIGGTVYEQAGWYTQIGLTVLAVMLCFFLPSNARIMRLENSHRRFSIGMQDVARAYHFAHAADREGLFQMSSEFDAVRERLAYLRDHPDLESLEPALLEAAAQMSHISRELADVYADEKVSRAREFLRQRQHEVGQFNERIAKAKQITSELKHWVHEVELEESVAASQLQRLQDELREILPEFGDEKMARADGTVISMPPKAAE
ncbi:DNA repair protein [Roseovarius sp. 2305UL8-3]|uniref:DNA repair protein n=1 Tax=Roseovarius conchicola TaxID=3121636 RepID=UPI003527C63F